MAALRPVVSEVVGDKPVASCLNATDAALNEDIKEVIMNASLRWLKNDEVLSVLEGFQIEDVEWPREAADKPQGKQASITCITAFNWRLRMLY